MNRLEIADVLDRAAVDITEHGLHKGAYVEMDDAKDITVDAPCCAAGAINRVVNGHPLRDFHGDDCLAVKEALLEYLGVDLVDEDDQHLSFEDYDDRIAKWNDEPERTAEQVVDTFRAAAAKLREQT